MTDLPRSPLLDPPLEAWDAFVVGVRPRDRVCVVHHGDLDGAIGAAYGRAALRQAHPGLDTPIHWVATEEYDFERLRVWVREQTPQRCCFFDMSVANHGPTMRFLNEHVTDAVFVFDHHVASGEPSSGKIVVANPTPAPLAAGERHIPTFLFSREVARAAGLTFPDWLTLLALFAEGVEQHYRDETAELFERCFGAPVQGPLRKAYSRSPLSRIASLVRAEYAATQKHHRVVDLLGQVAGGEVTTLDELRDALEAELADEAEAIAREISENVARWERRLQSHDALKERVVVIPVDAQHSVAGPVASILRGKFPDRVMLAFAVHNGMAIVELRTRNDTPLSFPAILGRVADEVELKNYGGHPSAAGASLAAGDIDTFVASLRRHVAAELDG